MLDSNSIKSVLATVAGFALASLTSSAAIVPDPVSGDLFLAFRASGGTGGSTSYIVKIGQDTPFRNAASGSSFTVSGLGNIVTDLTATYGSNWHNRTDLFWGIFGVRPSTSSIVYSSKERAPVSAITTPWPALDLTARNTTATQITSVLESTGGYKSRDATANSTVAAFQPNSANASSYNKQVATAGTNDFGSLSEWASIEGDFGGGAAGTALDLYRIASSGVTRVGSFSISSAGVVQFTAPTAVPVDTDGDGYFDSEETLAGTNPNDPSDFFKVQSLSNSPTSVGVSFHTIPSRTYQIYYSQDLSSNSWQLIGTLPGGAAPATTQYLDTDSVRISRAKGFYKVSVTQ